MIDENYGTTYSIKIFDNRTEKIIRITLPHSHPDVKNDKVAIPTGKYKSIKINNVIIIKTSTDIDSTEYASYIVSLLMRRHDIYNNINSEYIV